MKKSLKRKHRLSLILFLIGLVGSVAGGCGENVLDQQRQTGGEQQTASTWPEEGTTIQFTVEYSAGGGYDAYSRGLAPYIEKYLPGTTVTVLNKPGADGAVALNYLYRAKGDPTKIQIISLPGLAVRQLFSETQYDLSKLTWLGQIASGSYVTAVRAESPYQNIQDLLSANKQILVASAGIADTSAVTLVIAYDVLGFDFKIIPHRGMQEAVIAALRGDVDVVHATYSTILPMIKEGKIRALLAYTDQRLASIPDTPTAAEIGYPQLTGQIELRRPVAAPPDVDPQKTAILREAIWQAMSDPGFVAWCEETEREVAPLTGTDTEKSIADLVRFFETKKNLLEKYFKFDR